MKHLCIVATLLILSRHISWSSTAQNQSVSARQLVEQAIAALTLSPDGYHFKNFALVGTIRRTGAANEPVKIIGRHLYDLRFDISLADGSTHSVMRSRGKGTIRRPDGTSIQIRENLRVGTHAPFLPLPGLLADLLASGAVITDQGSETISGRVARHVSLARQFPPQADPGGRMSAGSRIDLFIDSQNFQIVQISHAVPDPSGRWALSRVATFADYRAVRGLMVPFDLSETIDGQTTWTITVTSIDLSPAIQDSDFQSY